MRRGISTRVGAVLGCSCLLAACAGSPLTPDEAGTVDDLANTLRAKGFRVSLGAATREPYFTVSSRAGGTCKDVLQ
jgi:hypothetical protein